MTTMSPEEVSERLVEAFEVLAATAKSDGPRAVLASWPEFRGKSQKRRRTYSPAAISRAEEAITWFSRIEDPDSRRALQFEIMCKAGEARFSRICEKYGWKRTTVACRNKVTLKKLAREL